jgi:hypothetical protein
MYFAAGELRVMDGLGRITDKIDSYTLDRFF